MSTQNIVEFIRDSELASEPLLLDLEPWKNRCNFFKLTPAEYEVMNVPAYRKAIAYGDYEGEDLSHVSDAAWASTERGPVATDIDFHLPDGYDEDELSEYARYVYDLCDEHGLKWIVELDF